ncbi:hypothetical protein [Megalodesulfovibrio paquesii]
MSPMVIKRSKQPGEKGGKGQGGAGSNPLRLILATALVTTVLIVAASYLLPYLPKSGPAAPNASAPVPVEREPAVPFPPIGQSPSRLIQPAAPPTLQQEQSGAAGTGQAAPAGNGPAASAVPQSAPPAVAEQASPPSQPSPAGGAVVRQALQDVASMAAPAAQQSPPTATQQTAKATPATPAPAPDKTAPQNKPVIQNDPPITPEDRGHKNTLRLAEVEKTRQGSCVLHLVSAAPMGRVKWLVLENPFRVAIDLIGSWDVNSVLLNRGDGLCARELRMGRHPDRIRVVVELAGGSTTGPRHPVLDKPTPKELVVTLPHR